MAAAGAALALGAASSAWAAGQEITGIQVFFRQDPLLSSGTYGGERWFAHTRFTSAVQEGTVATVEVRIQGLDGAGKAVSVTPVWEIADPGMVSVATLVHDRYRISVGKPGETRLVVAAAGHARRFDVSARSVNRGMQVGIVLEEAAPAAPEVASASEAPAIVQGLTDPAEQESYALGIQLGTAAKRQSNSLHADLVAQGVKDGLAGGPLLLSRDDVRAALLRLRAQARVRSAELTKDLGEKNRREGEAFLAENRARPDVVALPSGLQYTVLTPGTGATPTGEDTVLVHYRGTLLDGTEFDSTYSRGKPARLPVRRVMKGWREALQLMPAGSRWRLFVPPHLAYGKNGVRRSGIGPYATLVFDVQLMSIREAGEASKFLTHAPAEATQSLDTAD